MDERAREGGGEERHCRCQQSGSKNNNNGHGCYREGSTRPCHPRVLAPKDLRYPPPLCSMVYPDGNNDDDGGSGKKNDPKCDGVAGLRQGGRGGGGGQ
jgi:hypothetical protein